LGRLRAKAASRRYVSFGSPLLLLVLLVVPAMAALGWWFEHRRARHAVAFTNLDVLAAVATDTRRRWWRWIPLALFLLSLTAASAALARPRATVNGPASRATIVLLVDVSGSMRANDVKPSRLGAAQNAMNSFLDRVPKGVKVGLISFSTTPDVLVMPTTSQGQLREGIAFLSPAGGTAIGDGLALAVKVATSSAGHGPRSRRGGPPAAIVLLSDGAQTHGMLTPLQGAELAAEAKIHVYTVVLGTSHGTIGLYGLGGAERPLPASPDPVTLAAIARATGGQTYRVQTAARIEQVYRKLGSSITLRHGSREISSWFSGVAGLLLLSALGVGRLTGARLP
jgi:Ca-activated chloride channel family protein